MPIGQKNFGQQKYDGSSSGADQVPAESVYNNGTSNPSVYSHQFGNLIINKSGHLYIYVSNETSNVDVFFDNLMVTHVKGPLLEETHYYPWGLVMSGISCKSAGPLTNKFQYNGKERQDRDFSDGSGLEWLDYGARMYDLQVARWIVMDPMADFYSSFSPLNYVINNPVSTIDPDGMQVRKLIGTTTEDLVASAWQQTVGSSSSWISVGGDLLNQDDFAKIENETQSLISSGKYTGALKHLTSNIPSLNSWANWSDVSDINGNNYGGASLFETRADFKHRGKSELSINALALKRYDGSHNGYSIAGLAFDLYHEFYHVNLIAGRFGLSEVGSVERGHQNPQEEFLASYYAAMALLPQEPVAANYFYKRSVSPINYLLNYSHNPARYIDKYMDKIIQLLKGVDKVHQIQSMELIKKATGISIKL